MKDFVLKSSARKNKKSFLGSLTALGSHLIGAIKTSFIVFGFCIFAIFLLWLVLPQFMSVNKNINIVFINQLNDSHKDEILFASLDAESEQFKLFQLPENFEVTLFNLTQKQQQTQQLGVLLDPEKIADLTTTQWSWLTKRVVTHQARVSFTENITKSAVVSALFDDLLSNLNLTNFADVIEKLKFIAYVRKANFEFINLTDEQLPSNSVLPNACCAAVINTTNISGYAQSVTDLLETSGARVIRVDSSDQDEAVEQTQLAFDPSKPECASLVTILQQHLFIHAPQTIDPEKTQSLLNRYRADLVILLNTDQLFWGNSLQ